MLNARIRKIFAKKQVPIYSIGNPGDLTYKYTIIGNKVEDINKILNNSSDFSKKYYQKNLWLLLESQLQKLKAENML